MFKKNKAMLIAVSSMIATSWTPLAAADTTGKPLKEGREYMAVTNIPSNLNFVDLQDDTVYKTCEVPEYVSPGVVVMSPDNNRAYVLGGHFGKIYGFNVDTCDIEFQADVAQDKGVEARAMFSLAVSADGKEIYTISNPVRKYIDHYRVQEPNLHVFSTEDGKDAEPVRTFPAPRQLSIMQAAEDGSLYIAGPHIYKVNVETGAFDIAIKLRGWDREGFGDPDVLYFWPHQQKNKDFTIFYTAPKGESEFLYGYVGVNLETGETEVQDFGPVTEVYFSGQKHPNDKNLVYGVLNHLSVYNVSQQKQIQSQDLDHSYYNLNFNNAGDKIYLAGTLTDIGIYEADTLRKLGNIPLEGGDMSLTTAQVFIR